MFEPPIESLKKSMFTKVELNIFMSLLHPKSGCLASKAFLMDNMWM